MGVVDVIARDVRKLRDERARQVALAAVFYAAEMTSSHVEQGQVGWRVDVERTVNDEIKDHEEPYDGYTCEDPAW